MLYENGMKYTQIITAKPKIIYTSSATCNLFVLDSLLDLTIYIYIYIYIYMCVCVCVCVCVHFILNIKYHVFSA